MVWRRSRVFWRMRASLGLACAQVATLCTQVVGQPYSPTSFVSLRVNFDAGGVGFFK